MGGRKWTDEELVLLEELTEKYPLETVARRLNRTKEAVFRGLERSQGNRRHNVHALQLVQGKKKK